MSLETGTILVGGTTSTTGGTSTGFVIKGDTLNQKLLILDDGSNFFAATKIFVSVKDPQVSPSAPNGYTQARVNVKVVVPLTLANGKVTHNTIEQSMAYDPETTDAQRNSLRSILVQFVNGSAFDDLFNKQSLA